MKQKIHTFCHFKKIGALLAFVFLFATGLSAQRQITGTVTDDDTGDPLIGASVLIKGTSNGTITDIDGNFTVTANTGDVLEISYTGFSAQDVTVGVENNILVALSQGVLINEVVVTGYSVDSRRSTPGSVSTVDAQSLRVSPSGNVEQQLQGRVAGVTVVTNGQPGTTSQVRVRGYGALGGNAPLYVVDGVPVNSTDFLSPDDIETTTVLKDATAASIYGARASGGVIVYTTKKGNRGNKKMKVTYDGMFGVTTPGNGSGVLNPQEQADWTWKAVENAAIQNGITPDYSHPQYGSGSTPVLPDYLLAGGVSGGNITSADIADATANYNIDPEAGSIVQLVKTNKAGTDWYDAITRNAILNRHNLGISGGGEKSRYFVGMGMQEQEGVIDHQKFSRYTFRVNTEFDLLPILRVGENVQTTYRSARLLFGSGGGSGSSDDENVILSASRMSPAIPVYDEFGGYAGTSAPGFNNPANPRAVIDGMQNDRAFAAEGFGNVYMELEPVKDLVFRTSYGGRFQSFNFWNYTRRTYENSENNSSFGFSQSSNFATSWVWTNTANYKKDFGLNKINVLVGQEALNQGTNRGMGGSGINPFSQSVDFVGLSTVGSRVVNGGHSDGVNFSSYFGRLNYEYNDRYIISGVIRRDGSSRFGAENRWGTFPAVSAAWRISSEDFMSGIDVIDDLKIRAGYGVMGNSNNVDPNNQFSLFGTSIGASSYDIGGTNSSAAQGFYRTRIGNPLAKWEKAITQNVGIDALLYNGKWDIGIEFWKKETEDLLFQLPVTVQSGSFASAPSVNVGKMKNTGVDLKIVTKGRVKELGYEITLNGGFLNNNIEELAPGIENLPNRSSGYRGVTPVLNQVGQSISAFYGFEVQNIFADQAEVDGAAAQDGAAPGRFRFADLNGDNVIDLDDRTTLGSPVPDFTGGLTIRLDYGNFDLELYSFASIGNEIYNISKVFTDFYPLFPGAAISDRVKDSWSFANPNGTIPLFENTSNFSTNTQSNSFYVEDGSYFRMQNITLGYDVPTSVVSGWNIERLRVYASVNNVFTITGYSGLDPSVGGAADTNFGVDLGNFPITRSWTFGVNVGF